MNAQDKYELRKKLRMMRHATKQKGEKWGNKEMAEARDFILKTTKTTTQKTTTWQGASEPVSIASLFKLKGV